MGYYNEFVPVAAAVIESIYSVETQRQKAELLARAEIDPVALLRGRDRSEVEDRFRQLFHEYDIDSNGTLDIDEFSRCLQSTDLGLDTDQINTLMLSADSNEDGMIDYAEFMIFAY